jgi:hypothetical protein
MVDEQLVREQLVRQLLVGRHLGGSVLGLAPRSPTQRRRRESARATARLVLPGCAEREFGDSA